MHWHGTVPRNQVNAARQYLREHGYDDFSLNSLGGREIVKRMRIMQSREEREQEQNKELKPRLPG